jgi:transposase
MLVALLGVFAFRAVAAAAAQAKEAPFWSVPKSEGSKETKRLAVGETRFITAKACSGLGRERWVVERGFAHLHNFRRLRTRYERDPDIHLAFLTLACSVFC